MDFKILADGLSDIARHHLGDDFQIRTAKLLDGMYLQCWGLVIRRYGISFNIKLIPDGDTKCNLRCSRNGLITASQAVRLGYIEQLTIDLLDPDSIQQAETWLLNLLKGV